MNSQDLSDLFLRRVLVEARREIMERPLAVACRSQMFQDALPVAFAPLLAKFELAFQRLNLHFESDDTTQQKTEDESKCPSCSCSQSRLPRF